ncbi:MAG TPA: response regulator [Chloroflexi bacterium]|nr:response regulator [Chloroflexota bacterium]
MNSAAQWACRPSTLPTAAHGDALSASDDGVRILLADDDPQVRAFTARVLTWTGWSVTAVCNGREAVDAWPVDGEAFNLVILDDVMPEMNGFEAYRELSRRHPEALFLFVSAYAQGLNLDTFLHPGKTFFLAKPFMASTLVAVVRTALQAARRDAPLLVG